MSLRTLGDLKSTGRCVLVRVDFNVPVDQSGAIRSDRRILQALPSIEHLLHQGAKLILMSHLGRPKGHGFEAQYSMAPVAERLSQLIGKPVTAGPKSVVGPELDSLAAAMQPGDIVLMENLRFHAGETMPDQAEKDPGGTLLPAQRGTLDRFVAAIAGLADVYVNDAFGTCHRAHASLSGVPAAIQAAGGTAVAGRLVEKEVSRLSRLLSAPERPFILILGGAKVSDKIKLIARMLPKVDRLVIGGAMAYTFLKGAGTTVGRSRVDDRQLDVVRDLIAEAGDKIVLPSDHVAADFFDAKTMEAGEPVLASTPEIPESLMGMDIGPRTRKAYEEIVAAARTVLWNGPMGVSELSAYSAGTKAVAEAVAAATAKGAMTVIGGGDTVGEVEALRMEEGFTHVSTGGGASLAFLDGSPMPALEVLVKTADK